MADARKGNGFDKKLTTQYVSDIERHFENIASLKGEHAKKCRDVKELIDGVYEIAQNSGIPKKELKAVVKFRRLKRQAEAAREDLDDMKRQETFDQIRLALGDLSELPLGAAPLAQAPDAPVGDPNKEAAERNAAALKGGIKEMSEDGKAKARSGRNGRKAAAASEPSATETDEEDLRPGFLKRGSIDPSPVH